MDTSATPSDHVEVLKLNDEEAETLVGSADPHALHALGVPEVILTLGSQGAWVITPDSSSSTSPPFRSRAQSIRRAPATRTPSPTSCSVRRAPSRSRPPASRPRPSPRSSRLLEPELAARDDDRAPTAEDAARSRRRRRPRARRGSTGGRSRRPARSRSTLPTRRVRAWQRWHAIGPAAEPVAASSPRGQNMRVFQRAPAPATQLTPVTPNVAIAAGSGASAATASSLGERHDDVRRAVVVQLDRELRALETEHARAAAARRVERLDRRDRLLHPAEDERTRLVAIDLDGDDPGSRSRARRLRAGAAAPAPRPSRAPDDRRTASRGRGLKIRTRACLPSSAGSTKVVSEKPTSSASACMVSCIEPRASVKTASWLPASGVSVKTSTTRKRSVGTAATLPATRGAYRLRPWRPRSWSPTSRSPTADDRGASGSELRRRRGRGVRAPRAERRRQDDDRGDPRGLSAARRRRRRRCSGSTPATRREELRERMGVVLQQSELSPLLTVRETHASSPATSPTRATSTR